MKYPKEKIVVPLEDAPAFHERLRSRRRVIKSFEAKARVNRTPAEKIADTMTNSFGSMGFLISNVVWFSLWMLINTNRIPGVAPFDPFPFGLLTTMVSLEAIFLAIIVLLSQNRASRIDDLRQEVDLQINTLAEEEITKIIELQMLLLQKNGIDVSHDLEIQQMLKPTDTERIEKSLEKQL